MSLSGHIYNLLVNSVDITNLVRSRIYPLYVPEGENVNRDCIIYTIVSVVPDHVMQGPSGLVNARVQIDCWARNYTDMITLGDAVRLLLDGYKGTCEGTPITSSRLLNSFDNREISDSSDELSMCRRMLEFEIWYKEYKL